MEPHIQRGAPLDGMQLMSVDHRRNMSGEFAQLTVVSPVVSAELLNRVAARHGSPEIAALPPARPDGDRGAAFEELARRARDAGVMLFPGIAATDLDRFFWLRLLQILRREPVFPGLSIVVLAPGASRPSPIRPLLAGGFAARFRMAWPFARCVFLTETGDGDSLSETLGLPVGVIDDSAKLAGTSDGSLEDILRSEAIASQKIALQFQRIWGRCGSTTGFENQIESLVGAGFLTIRVFADAVARRGATLDARLAQIIPENSDHAGAHINTVAVPDGPPTQIRTRDPDAAWATWLAATATCRIVDPMLVEAAHRADSVIGNHLESVGPAITLAPQARLLLDIRDDRARATRELMLRDGKSDAEILTGEAAASRAQARVLAIPDMCGHVSRSEFERLAPHTQRSAILLPRVYASAHQPDRRATGSYQFDVLVFGDEHPFNISSLRWFLDEVWTPHLAAENVSVAIAGRVGNHVDDSAHQSPLLHVLGFVDDLDAVRSACRLTVVPDRHGTGTAIKMLATLAALHPLASTSVGLRGVDPAISGLLPAHDEGPAMAQDILAMLRDPERLAERRNLVEQAQAAIRRGPDHAALLQALPRPTPSVRAERQSRWAQVIAQAVKPGAGPFHLKFGTAFPMSGNAWDHRVLGDGWHGPEQWGRWMDGTEATLSIALSEPVAQPLTLELDIVPSPAGATLSIEIDGAQMPSIEPIRGPIRWPIPPEITLCKTGVLVTLRTSEAVCPALAGPSSDHRFLGIGVASVRLLARDVRLYEMGKYISMGANAAHDEILLTGWHQPEAWGCWSNGPSATIELWLPPRQFRPLWLELDLAPSPAGAELTVTVNDRVLAAIVPVSGGNQWLLPASILSGKSRVLVTLTVSRTIRPADVDGSGDLRVLGIGLRGVRLVDVEK